MCTAQLSPYAVHGWAVLLGGLLTDADELFDFLEYFSYALDTRIATHHEACTARGVRMPLPTLLRPGEPKFEDCLAGCVGSTPPRRRSPLWHAYWVDGDGAGGGAVVEKARRDDAIGASYRHVHY